MSTCLSLLSFRSYDAPHKPDRGSARPKGLLVPWPTTSRQSRGYGAEWDRTRKVTLRRDKYLCQPCLSEGRITPATQVDHRTSKAKGGTDDEDNLQAICTPCHTAKTTLETGGRIKVQVGADGWPVAE